MFVPQRGDQRKGNEPTTSTEDTSSQACSRHENTVEEQLTESLMWSGRSVAGQIQRGGRGLDITNENTPRYAGSLNYPGRDYSTLEREETNYSFRSTLPSTTMEREETSNELSNLPNMRLACLHAEDSIRDSSQDNTASLASPPIVRPKAGAVAQGNSYDAHAGDSEATDTIREEGHANSDLERPTMRLISAPVSGGMQSISNDSQPEFPHPTVLELSLVALTLEDTGHEGSLLPDTDIASGGEQLIQRGLSMPWESSEQRDTALVPVRPSKSTTGFITCAGYTGSTPTPTVRQRSKIHSANKPSSSSYGRKLTVDTYEDHSTDEDDDTPERPRSNVSQPQNVKSPNNLACPFFKHDPEKYNPTNYHGCATTPWRSIHRLKEHLRRVHMVRTYCNNCKQTFEDSTAVESHRSFPDAEMSGVCDCQDESDPAGTITSAMVSELRNRWRNKPTREKWERIYGILFPGETIPWPYLDTVPTNSIPSNQTQHTPSLEKPAGRKLRSFLRIYFDQSTNEYLKSVPDDVKAEIVEDMSEKLQLELSKSSPDQTPRILPPHAQYHFETQSQSLGEQTMELPIPIENGDLSGGESSNQGLGLTWFSSESLYSSPREGSFTGPDLPRCKCKGKCECPPWPTTYFNEQYMVSENSGEDQWPDITDLIHGNSDQSMF